MLNPAAYVHQVKIAQSAKSQQVTEATVAQATLERAPNYRHPDGRIYASKPGEPYFAVSVSPFNPKFMTQIEPGIAPVVQALLARNYLPISSCEGHGDSRSFVRIVFGTKEAADKFVADFGELEYTTLKRLDTSANVIQQWHNGTPSWRAPYETETVRQDLEAVDVNILFARNYQQVCYVDIILYQMQEGFLHYFKRQLIINDLHRNKQKRIQDIADRILSLDSYML